MVKIMAGEKTLGVTLEVHSPAGAVETASFYAPRLDSLEGKTLCELSDGVWEDHRTFPQIRKLLQDQFPTATIIPWSEFPCGLLEIDDDEVAKLVKERGCHGVIVGNAA